MNELFEHTADLGLRVVAPDLNTLFREAAEGLFSMIVEEIPAGGEPREFAIDGDRHDFLLLDWLSELLFVFETKKLLLRDFEVQVDDRGVRARALAQPLDLSGHCLLHEVKAITYHGLKVEPHEAGFMAEVIVDI